MQSLTFVAILLCAALGVISSQDVASFSAGHPATLSGIEDTARTGRQYDPSYYGAFQYGRLFFTTRTAYIATSTFTATSTTVTTCTTSTSALSSCVAATGRRRRALFHEDDKEESIFLPAPAQSQVAIEKEVESIRSPREVVVPIMLEPGFAAANGIAPRFLVAFATSTTTKTTTTTSTSSVIATCSSVSNFQLCGSSGK